jgi:hypothetical protein
MDQHLEALLIQIGEDDPRYEAVKKQRHVADCCMFKRKSGNNKPMCRAYLDNGVIATVLGKENAGPEDWFRQIVEKHADKDESVRLTIEIENVSVDSIFKGRGVIARPVNVEAEATSNQLNVIVDELGEYLSKPENAGKCDERPRGRKDPELMTLVRIAARRAGYTDDTPSASYSPFINAVLWLAAEEGLLFRVRHAIIQSKGGDAHYTNEQ